MQSQITRSQILRKLTANNPIRTETISQLCAQPVEAVILSDQGRQAGPSAAPFRQFERLMTPRLPELQRAIGLEWYLLVDDPWRIAMSTDHPNGGSFMAYPEIIALLMDRTRRQEVLDRAPPGVKERCDLADLDREYSLYEIAIITRASPARILGLERKGHLGPGADEDVTIYSRDDDVQRMFELPRYVIHHGSVVVDDGEVLPNEAGTLFHVEPAFDLDVIPDIQEWFEEHYTIRFNNYPVDGSYLQKHESIPTRGA